MQRLIWSDSIVDEARKTRDRVEVDLRGAGIVVELLVTGPASMSGVLTKGDVDLHLRVAGTSFNTVIDRLSEMYRPSSLPAWGATLAVFDIPATRSTGLAATPIGSEHDRRFTTAWRRLRGEPGLLEQYNALKLECFGTVSYEERKTGFFSAIADR